MASPTPIPYAPTPELPPLLDELWAILRTRRGRARAVSAQKLAHWTSFPERQVRRALKELIEQHHRPIASTPQAPAGFFVPESRAEVEAVCASLRGRALSILRRMACLRQIAMPQLLEQLQLEFTAENAEPAENPIGSERPKEDLEA